MKFRQITTKSETIILAGKDENSNEELVKQIEKDEEVFHTEKPGSPFVNIKGKAKKEDVKIAAIFCAAKSQDWRDNKKDVLVHQFKGKDIFKIKGMKTGTFGVKKHKAIKVKKSDIEKWVKEN